MKFFSNHLCSVLFFLFNSSASINKFKTKFIEGVDPPRGGGSIAKDRTDRVFFRGYFEKRKQTTSVLLSSENGVWFFFVLFPETMIVSEENVQLLFCSQHVYGWLKNTLQSRRIVANQLKPYFSELPKNVKSRNFDEFRKNVFSLKKVREDVQPQSPCCRKMIKSAWLHNVIIISRIQKHFDTQLRANSEVVYVIRWKVGIVTIERCIVISARNYSKDNHSFISYASLPSRLPTVISSERFACYVLLHVKIYTYLSIYMDIYIHTHDVRKFHAFLVVSKSLRIYLVKKDSKRVPLYCITFHRWTTMWIWTR